MMHSLRFLAAPLLVSCMASAGDLPPDLMAQFIKKLGPVVGQTGKATVKDPAMAELVKAQGVELTPDARLTYAATAAEIKAYKGQPNRVILVPRLDMLPLGGAIAVIEEGGKPQIYLHVANYQASGVPLSDMLLRIGKPAK